MNIEAPPPAVIGTYASDKDGRRIVTSVDETQIDAILAEVSPSHLPGVAVGIAVTGKPRYRRGFGLASLELPVTLSTSMRMRIGSTTKHFACLAYLLLCEEGRAGVDDAIVAHLPEMHSITHRVSLRQLMGNIGGLRDAHDICWQFSGRGQPVSSDELLDLYRDIDHANAQPGESWIYCNGGFLLLSAVIERITGQTLEDVLRERIFEPVGMHDTLLRRWDTDFVPNSATLHMSKVGGGYERSYLGTALAGEGGIVSTVDDMLRWLAHMDAPVVGSAASWALMKEPLVLNNGHSTGYGLGLFTTEHRGVERLHHPGGVMGGNAQMLKVPAAGLDVIVMSNRHDVSAVLLAERIVEACVRGLDSSPCLDRVCMEGLFQSQNTARTVQLYTKHDQQIASIDGVDIPVEPDGAGGLRPAGASYFLHHSIIPVGGSVRPTSIRFEHFGNVDELMAVDCDLSVAADICGRYSCAGTKTDIVITRSDGCVHMQTAGPYGSVTFRLERLSGYVWRARSKHPTPRDGVLTFDRDGAAFRYSNDRLWSLIFKRHA